MENNKMTKEKREALIDSILAEARSGAYKPKARASVRTVNRQEDAEKNDVKSSSDNLECMPEQKVSAPAITAVIPDDDKIIESSRITAEKIEKIRRQKLEKQKAEKLRAEEAAINISQPDFSETESKEQNFRKSCNSP